jgi:hypothetical protein
MQAAIAVVVVAALLLVTHASCSTTCEIKLFGIGGSSGDISIECAGPAAPVSFRVSAQLLSYLNSTAGGLPSCFTLQPLLCILGSSLAYQNLESGGFLSLFVGVLQPDLRRHTG